MTYIGLSPPNTFTKSTSQTFTGNGSTTAFTLQTRVSSPEDLEVFVSNVQQQPTESYTIGSDGVTMTFSEAPPSGTFYVIYRTVAQQAGTDTGASRLEENNTFTGTNTFNAQVDVKSNLLVTSEATSGYDPILKIYRDQSDTPQDNDPLGQLDFAGKNDAGQQVNFFRMRAKIKDASDGSEDGQMVFKVMTNGTNTDRITIEGGQPIELDGGVDINGGELILDADADTSITADTDDQIDIKVGGNDTAIVTADTVKIRSDNGALVFRRTTSETDIAKIQYVHGNPSLDIGGDGKNIRFINGSSYAETMRVGTNGNITIQDGNLVIGTAGHGIDFSVNTASSVTGTSNQDELLDHYEEGTFTPTIYGSSGSAGSQNIINQEGRYVKVGRVVYITLYLVIANGGAGSWTGTNRFGGLPFTNGVSNRQALSIGADGLNGDEHTFTISGSSAFGHVVDMFTGAAFNYSSFITGYSIQMSGSYYTT